MDRETYLEKHREEIFKKYTNEELINDINNFKRGKGKLTKTINHFFEELIFECKGIRGDKSPMEALQDDELVYKIVEFINSKPNFYTGSEISNIKSFFRNAGKWASKVSNFCPRNALVIYNRYNNNNNKNVLDTSMGFGSRMSGALLSENNYYGFDPNVRLCEKLDEYYKFMKRNKLIKNHANIYCQGSEILIEELKNKIDVSFTSPPYFNIEEYSKDEGQSIIKFSKYNDWIDKFARPTIENTYAYLKVGGYAMINIKNISRNRNGTKGKKERLFDDWFEIFESIDGFEFVEVFELKHQSKRQYDYTGGKLIFEGFKEPVMVFKKTK